MPPSAAGWWCSTRRGSTARSPARSGPSRSSSGPADRSGSTRSRLPARADEATVGRRLALLAALAGTCLGRPLGPAEHAGIELALAACPAGPSGPTLPDVVEALLEPADVAARSVGTDLASLRQETRTVALALRRLVRGELHGMFDGPTSPGTDLSGPAVVLDLSHLYRSPALGALVACAVASLETGWRSAAASARTLLVVDEAWAVLEDLGVARFLQSSWKLARAHGVANVAVVHRVSDLGAAGPAGSVAAKVAEGLLADSETLVLIPK